MDVAISARRVTAVFPVLAMIAGVACGGGGDNTSNDPLTVGGSSETVVISDNSFAPGNLQVPVGAVITFTNEDSAQHDAKARDGSWETSDLRKGDSDSIMFETAGEFAYYCEFHPSMKARVSVIED